MSLLESLTLPGDLKKLSLSDLEGVSEEIRQEMIAVCLKNGGHLGASLGTVELAVSVHRIFDSSKDKIIWDVGHQAYAHKILTGRLDRFSTLRKSGGLSGFLSREESEYDFFGAGHSSTSISAAMGFSFRSSDWSVAIIGDGALTAGLSFEALNNLSHLKERGPFLIILNDNQWSISENVGSIPEILQSGEASSFFEQFGIRYVGPVSGHHLPELLGTLNGIHEMRPGEPILLHVLTQKGKGFFPAEDQPVEFHGISPRSDKAGPEGQKSSKSWSVYFSETLIEFAQKDERVLAITAAMGEGTGLSKFQEKFSERFFDVGIAEPHAVTFAAGLSAAGWKPVVAIYSSFLQRGIDSLIHDVALQKLPVVFAVDRAGFVGADGPTHHGVFDLAYGRMIPGVRIFTPATAEDLRYALREALNQGASPTLIRYPRGDVSYSNEETTEAFRILSKNETLSRVLITFGPLGLHLETLETDLVIQVVRPVPFSEELLGLLKGLPADVEIHTFEDGVRAGGLGEMISALLSGRVVQIHSLGNAFLPHGEMTEIKNYFSPWIK